MHAIVMRSTGDPDVFEWEEVADPDPSPGRVVVDVEVAGVNFIDTYHRRGLYPVEMPFTPGVDGAGTVAAVPDGTTWPSPGDRVAWFGPPGSYAERASVPVDRVVAVPDDVTLEAATAAMTQGLTAHYLATATYRLAADDTCLVHAGAGGVGRLLIQMAKRLGATVYTTVSTPEKADVAGAAGADHVIRYTEEDFAEAARRIAGTDRPFDVVYDGVGSTTFEAGLTLIRPRGTMALFGQASGPVEAFDPQALNANGSLFLTRPSLGDHVATREELDERAADVFGGIVDGWLTVEIGAEFPLRDAAEAHRALEGRRTTGKVLLRR
ncbi:MAG: quinone oxidoreductase [Acidimicrobiia bacterium]|nr:quinone oxidoreductase [Acidimicrobiia bacterium]